MNLNIATKEDVEALRKELLDEIRQLHNYSSKGVKKYLRTSELKKMLNVSSATIQNLRINGTLPYKKLGSTILYDLEEINKIFDENSFN